MWRPSRKSSPDAIAAALVLAAAVTVAATSHQAVFAADGGNPVVAAREILADASYQTQPPGNDTGEIRFPLRLGRLARLVVYGLAIILVVILGAWLYEAFSRGESPGPGGVTDGAARVGGEGSLAAGRLEADRLAEEGRYGEAVHALLLLSIRHLSLGHRTDPAPSSTSRELVRTLPRTPDERTAFTRLVHLVELSFFGGRPVTAGDYDDSRRCFGIIHPAGLS